MSGENSWIEAINTCVDSEISRQNLAFLLEESKEYFNRLKDANNEIKENSHKLLYIYYLIISGELGFAVHFFTEKPNPVYSLGSFFLTIGFLHLMVSLFALIPTIKTKESHKAGISPRTFCNETPLHTQYVSVLKGFIVNLQTKIDKEIQINDDLAKHYNSAVMAMPFVFISTALFFAIIISLEHISLFSIVPCS